MTISDCRSDPGTARRRFHPAWTMVIVAALALIAAGSFTTMAGLVTQPLVDSKGWSRTAIGVGVGINMVLYGAVAPFAAAAMDRYGLRRVTVAALALLVAGSLLVTTVMPGEFFFVLWWGLLVGVGTGSITMVFGATVANRWFRSKIGLATGLLTAAGVAGQFAMLPLLSVVLSHTGWRGPALVCGAIATVALICVPVFLKDSPHAVGVLRYGATDGGDDGAVPPEHRTGNPFRRTVAVLLMLVRDKRFWLLASMFALCGATTNGLMWSHFTPAAHDHGMAATTASGLLAIIGLTNIIGTVGAGWLSDRIEPRALLALFFLGRAVALAVLPILFASHLNPSLITFAVAFGILDVATVPPTLALCRHYFADNGAPAFGWVNVFHQLGAGSMGLLGGLIRDLDGSYTPVWITGAAACLVAALLGVTVSRIHLPAA
ncbi:MFS transporter [Nocardia nova]|uniref:MFS transporter n=1 Tax=Nocardia nova TaxID=37330 RepID=UPI0033F605E4